jgi:hypothetical protein
MIVATLESFHIVIVKSLNFSRFALPIKISVIFRFLVTDSAVTSTAK